MCRSRSQVIWLHVERFIRSSACSWPTYAVTVREHYERLVDEGCRLIPWSDNRDPHTRARNDAQTLRRFQASYEHAIWAYDIPADLEEAMVFALDELGYVDYRHLMTELAGRFGMLPVMVPVAGPCSDLLVAANVMRESAEAIEAISRLTADDGQITVKDKAVDLRRAQIEIREAMAALSGAEGLVLRAMNEKGITQPTAVRVVK